MSDGIEWYLNAIGSMALLSSLEERELSQTIERGVEARGRMKQGERGRDINKAIREAEAAKDRFIRANLRLVVRVARRYRLLPGMDLLDLIQEGNLGLMHAVEKFDWRKGVRFSAYATWWIHQAIGRALDQKASLVRLPSYRSASLRTALRQSDEDGDELDNEHARLHQLTTPISLDRMVVVGEQIGWMPGADLEDDDSMYLIKLTLSLRPHRHLGRDLEDDDGMKLIGWMLDTVAGSEVEVMAKVENEMVTGLLEVLESRAKHAVKQRFGLLDGRKRSYREVGEELGVTAEAARRLVKRAIHKVRAHAVTVSLSL